MAKIGGGKEKGGKNIRTGSFSSAYAAAVHFCYSFWGADKKIFVSL